MFLLHDCSDNFCSCFLLNKTKKREWSRFLIALELRNKWGLVQNWLFHRDTGIGVTGALVPGAIRLRRYVKLR